MLPKKYLETLIANCSAKQPVTKGELQLLLTLLGLHGWECVWEGI